MSAMIHEDSEVAYRDVAETIVDGADGFFCLVCQGYLEYSFQLSKYGMSQVLYVHRKRTDYKRCQFMRGIISGART